MHLSANTIIIISALLLFSIYRRVRRNIGWQHLDSEETANKNFYFPDYWDVIFKRRDFSSDQSNF